MENQFLNRDISWLSFNGRVLQEAARNNVPLMERFRFLSIFSSNLDEFYRVRMPAIMLLHNALPAEGDAQWLLLQQANSIIRQQQQLFGKILTEELIPELQRQHIHLWYNEPLPVSAEKLVKEYFLSEVLAFLEINFINKSNALFFAKSNALYIAVSATNEAHEKELIILNIPSAKTARFFAAKLEGQECIFFLDDIIKQFLPLILPGYKIEGAWNIKITRDAELDLADEYEGDLAEKIERQLAKRDDGSATRFLYDPEMPVEILNSLFPHLKISPANAVSGGHYHNLKDLGNLPLKAAEFNYPKRLPLSAGLENINSLFDHIAKKDRIIHTPYQSYAAILQFFNEAATDIQVREIYVTLYRVAGDSKIVNALITAAKNGKKVTVFIELKARFDEANNLKWSKRMKAAGVHIINSIPGLKVHAKVALVKRQQGEKLQYTGLVATGNLNENTARFYTDHVLLTNHPEIVRELELLFVFLSKKRKPASQEEISFKHLLIAQFNLQQSFIEMIDREISNAKEGRSSGIIIKMNNLEEQTLISKLYEASQAGVKIKMIVRSICCLAPGIAGISENISVIRIVDRYLEHGRIFIFNNDGDEKIFIGSADWMNRNIYRRIEVCCPVYDNDIKKELKKIIQFQLDDNLQAVEINTYLDNKPVPQGQFLSASQTSIYHFLKENSTIPGQKEIEGY